MKGERVGGEAELFGNLPGRHPIRTGLDKQPEDFKAVFLGERRQRGDSIQCFHISTNIESFKDSQGRIGPQSRGQCLYYRDFLLTGGRRLCNYGGVESRSVKDAFREGIPECGASAVPAGGRIRSAPGRLGHHVSRHYDRGARCVAGLGQAMMGNTHRTASQETWPEPSPGDDNSLGREPRWNAGRRARCGFSASRIDGCGGWTSAVPAFRFLFAPAAKGRERIAPLPFVGGRLTQRT